MASTFPITPPADNAVTWAIQNPEQVRELVELANKLASLEIVVTQGTKVTRCPVRFSGENAQIQITIT